MSAGTNGDKRNAATNGVEMSAWTNTITNNARTKKNISHAGFADLRNHDNERQLLRTRKEMTTTRTQTKIPERN